MKNFFTISCELLIVSWLLCSNFASGQTFQNTFLPTGDDNYVAGVAVNNNYWVIGNTNSFAPALGTEHILFSKYSGVTGASVWDRKYYDGANTGVSYTATDIQAGYSALTPSPGNSNPPLPCTFTTCPMAGPAVNVLSQPNSKNYFYVTGYYKDSLLGVRRLLIMKLNNTGGVLWARTNLVTSSGLYDETGVSVESCPNGDVITVSAVTNGAGTVFPAVTRLNITGALVWRYHYPPATFEPAYNFIPHQSCKFKEQTPNIVNKPTGIAITGEYNLPGAAGSSFFVMRIAYNGGMIWKFNYPLILPAPAITNDVGWDIMTEAESLGAALTSDNFIVTGLTNATGVGPIPGALGFAARVATVNGAFVNCYRFGVPAPTFPPAPFTYGQGIFQSSTAAANVVITGGCNNPAGGLFTDTYFLEMNITNGTLVASEHYPLTTPNYPRTESIVAVGTAFPTPGYFISTNSFDTYGGGTLTDGHVIKTDLTGSVNATDCPSDTLKILRDSVLANVWNRCTNQKCDTILAKSIKKKNIVAPHTLCFSATKLTDHETALSFEEGEILVYPNPADGDQVTLFFAAEESREYTIRMMDINGKEVLELRGIYEEGTREVLLPTGDLQAGIYMITLSDGQSSVATKLIKMKN